MSVVGGRTIERRTRISQPDDESARCRALRAKDRPNDSFNPCSHLQYLQRPTSPDFSVDAPRLLRRGDGHLACGSRGLETKLNAAFSHS